MRVYENIHTYIKKNGLNMSGIAAKTGIPKTTLNAILSGKQTMDASHLRAICIALNERSEKFMQG